MKSLPLIPDLVSEVERLTTAAWNALNGRDLTRGDVAKMAYLLSEIRWYARYGKDGQCPAALYHGPGHQSRCGCDLPLDGHAVHCGDVMGESASWRGLVAFTTFEAIDCQIRAGAYETTLPCGEPRSPERAAYREEQAKESEFRQHVREALEAMGVPAGACAAVERQAWEDGHAYGFSEVLICAQSLGELAVKVAAAERSEIRQKLLGRICPEILT